MGYGHSNAGNPEKPAGAGPSDLSPEKREGGTRRRERTRGGKGTMRGGEEEGGERGKGGDSRRVKERVTRDRGNNGANGGKGERRERGERRGGGGGVGGEEGAALMIPEFLAVGGGAGARGKEGLSLRVVSYNVLAQAC
ncbi:hypothetical protein CLOM_g3585 [Closterium sp. NIES-68]|nr:hypothetical protein CLOM_g3585 [Closterium sp. NIES-68]